VQYLRHFRCVVWLSGPFFVVNHKRLEYYRSPVYDRVKKGDISLLMVLTQPVIVCGDIMVEFFNKQKMLAKVRFGVQLIRKFKLFIAMGGPVLVSVTLLSFAVASRWHETCCQLCCML